MRANISLAFCIGALLLSACSSGASLPAAAPSAATAGSGGNSASRGGYPVVDPASLFVPSVLGNVGQTNLTPVTGAAIGIAAQGFLQHRPSAQNARSTQSAFGGSLNDGHGQDGYFINAPLDEDHATTIVIHSVWIPGSDVVLNQPPNGGNAEYLYAPTTHPPNSCLEVGSAYMNLPPPSANATQGYIYFYNFCRTDNPFAWFTNDANFRSTYVFWDASTNAPSMGIAISTMNSPIATPDWTAYVWNVVAQRWDLFYTQPYATRQAAPETIGWSIFEPNLQAQPSIQACRQPQVPSFSVDALHFVNLQNSATTYVTAANSSRTTAGACVTADVTGQASFAFDGIQPNWSWMEQPTGQ
jgi:hypothetical protein